MCFLSGFVHHSEFNSCQRIACCCFFFSFLKELPIIITVIIIILHENSFEMCILLMTDFAGPWLTVQLTRCSVSGNLKRGSTVLRSVGVQV